MKRLSHFVKKELRLDKTGKSNRCPECHSQHDPELPHDALRAAYRLKFHEKHKRFPTWTDAMAHCSDEMKAAWKKALEEQHGVDVYSINVYGNRKLATKQEPCET